MLVIVGYIVILGSVFGGYALAGGHLAVLFQPLELLMIGGAALGGTVGAVAGAFGKNKAGRSLLGRMGKGGKTGLVVGGLLAGGMALRNRNKQAENNEWYNKRLNYAQRQARRREKQDWKTNMTQRDGYSY
mgnify:CR=1 FL=1